MDWIIALATAVLAAFASSFFTMWYTKRKIIPDEYKRARAELAYTEYIKNKNEAYQQLFKQIKITEGNVYDLVRVIVSNFSYNRHNLDDIKSFMRDDQFTKYMTEEVEKAWEKGRDNGIMIYKEFKKEVEDLKQNESIAKLNNLIIEKQIYLSADVLNISRDVINKLRKMKRNKALIRSNEEWRNPLPVGKKRTEYLNKMMDLDNENRKLMAEISDDISGKQVNDNKQTFSCLANIMRDELDQTNLSIPKQKKPKKKK